MIRVKVLRPTLIVAGEVAGVDQVLTLPDGVAQQLIARGRAVAVLDLPEGGVADGAPVPEHRDPVPARTRRR